MGFLCLECRHWSIGQCAQPVRCVDGALFAPAGKVKFKFPPPRNLTGADIDAAVEESLQAGEEFRALTKPMEDRDWSHAATWRSGAESERIRILPLLEEVLEAACEAEEHGRRIDAQRCQYGIECVGLEQQVAWHREQAAGLRRESLIYQLQLAKFDERIVALLKKQDDEYRAVVKALRKRDTKAFELHASRSDSLQTAINLLDPISDEEVGIGERDLAPKRTCETCARWGRCWLGSCECGRKNYVPRVIVEEENE